MLRGSDFIIELAGIPSLARLHPCLSSTALRAQSSARYACSINPKLSTAKFNRAFSKTPPPHAKLAFHPPTMVTGDTQAHSVGYDIPSSPSPSADTVGGYRPAAGRISSPASAGDFVPQGISFIKPRRWFYPKHGTLVPFTFSGLKSRAPTDVYLAKFQVRKQSLS